MKSLKHGDILPEEYRKLFPEDVYDLIVQISRQGFGLTLVGGAVRDYLLEGELSNDLDFEIRHSFEYSEEEWVKMLTRLSETLKKKFSFYIEELPFNIIKIKQGSFNLELSSPRFEKYSGDPPFGHSEFDVELSPNMTYKDSFKRRDFTINALGIEFGAPGADDEFKFVDPYNAVEDLKKKILRPCGDDFYCDPVRMLRLIRFSEKLKFEFVGDLKKFDLSELSSHYFFQEGLKNFFPVARSFFKKIKSMDIELAIDLKDLSFLKEMKFEDMGALTKDEVLMAIIFSGEELSEGNRNDFVRLSGMKVSSGEDYETFRQTLKKLGHINDSILKNKLRHKNFIELLDDIDFKELKALHQIFNRHRFGRLEVLGKIDSKIYKKFSYFKNLFGEETKGKTLASKLMSMVKENEKRSVISIYCHLLVHFNLRPIFPDSRFGN